MPRYAEGVYSNFFYECNEIEEVIFPIWDKRVDPDVMQSFNSIKYNKRQEDKFVEKAKAVYKVVGADKLTDQ